MPTFPAEQLTQFAVNLLAAGGLDADEAKLVATSLVGANLRGHDSHGMMRIPSYLDWAEKGHVVPGAQFKTLVDAPSILTVDGNWGFGQTQARRLTERLIEKAQASGVGVGTMIHCSHIGRLGEYCEAAAAEGLVSMMTVNNHGAVVRVSPPGGKEARLSTNPLAIGIPNNEEPVVIDFCTCATAEGKVRVKKIAGQFCPDGWVLDSEGRPTNDPEKLYADLRAAGVEVLFDDRGEKAGYMFNDADLIGIPLRLIVSPKTLAEGQVEFKRRESRDKTFIEVDQAVAHITACIAESR